MSRSAFAARFADVVGEPAMRYLTSWRLRLARNLLRESDEPIGVVAEKLGYRSEAAFCRAFKRELGVSPGSDRRARDHREHRNSKSGSDHPNPTPPQSHPASCKLALN